MSTVSFGVEDGTGEGGSIYLAHTHIFSPSLSIFPALPNYSVAALHRIRSPARSHFLDGVGRVSVGEGETVRDGDIAV